MTKFMAGQVPCDLIAIAESGARSVGYGLAFRKNYPLLHDFDAAILELQEDGTISRLQAKWWQDRCRKPNLCGCKDDPPTDDDFPNRLKSHPTEPEEEEEFEEEEEVEEEVEESSAEENFEENDEETSGAEEELLSPSDDIPEGPNRPPPIFLIDDDGDIVDIEAKDVEEVKNVEENENVDIETKEVEEVEDLLENSAEFNQTDFSFNLTEAEKNQNASISKSTNRSAASFLVPSLITILFVILVRFLRNF